MALVDSTRSGRSLCAELQLCAARVLSLSSLGWSLQVFAHLEGTKPTTCLRDTAPTAVSPTHAAVIPTNAAVSPTNGSSATLIGRAILKSFVSDTGSNEMFRGHVATYSAKTGYFSIAYADGDHEEMTETEVRRHLVHQPDLD